MYRGVKILAILYRGSKFWPNCDLFCIWGSKRLYDYEGSKRKKWYGRISKMSYFVYMWVSKLHFMVLVGLENAILGMSVSRKCFFLQWGPENLQSFTSSSSFLTGIALRKYQPFYLCVVLEWIIAFHKGVWNISKGLIAEFKIRQAVCHCERGVF